MTIQLLMEKIRNIGRMQLTDEQCVFVVKRYFQTWSYKQVQDEFVIRFPGRVAPQKTTIKRNVEKYEEHGTSLNRNKGCSGRRITVRTPQNIQAVRQRKKSNWCKLKKEWFSLFNVIQSSILHKNGLFFKIPFLDNQKSF